MGLCSAKKVRSSRTVRDLQTYSTICSKIKKLPLNCVWATKSIGLSEVVLAVYEGANVRTSKMLLISGEPEGVRKRDKRSKAGVPITDRFRTPHLRRYEQSIDEQRSVYRWQPHGWDNIILHVWAISLIEKKRSTEHVYSVKIPHQRLSRRTESQLEVERETWESCECTREWGGISLIVVGIT